MDRYVMKKERGIEAKNTLGLKGEKKK